jgi:hypothetical protein
MARDQTVLDYDSMASIGRPQTTHTWGACDTGVHALAESCIGFMPATSMSSGAVAEL